MGKLQLGHEKHVRTAKSNFHFFRDAKFRFGVTTYLWERDIFFDHSASWTGVELDCGGNVPD
mgnify:CR=1 FL=1